MKKIISLLLTICLIVTSFTTVAAADNSLDELNIDGYEIQVLEDNAEETVVKTFVDGVEYELIFDADAEEYSMSVKDYPASIFDIGIGIAEEETFTIEVENMDEDCVEAEIISDDTDEVIVIDETLVEAQATAVVVVSGTAIAAALLKAILAVTAAVVVAGITYYAASKVAARLKRDQPKIHYYRAYLRAGDNVYVGPRLNSKSAAASVLRSGGNVFAISSGYAYDACKSASPIGQVSGRQKHSGGGRNYYHYHPMVKRNTQSKAHCWYI